jgi:hypothetical protein
MMIYRLNVKIPEKYEILENALNENDIIEFYKDVVDSRLHYLNGYNIDNCFDFGYICDFCSSKIHNEDYYYCLDCRKDICILCYKELANFFCGNNYDECKIHSLIKRSFFNYSCDDCGKSIKKYYYKYNLNEFYHKNIFYCNNCINDELIKKFNLNKKFRCISKCENCKNELYFQEIYVNSFDICLNCEINYEIIDNKLIYNNHILEKKFIEDYSNYGSFLDWIPLINDDEGNIILYNANLDAKYFKRCAIYLMDSHGRVGIFMLNKLFTINDLKKLWCSKCDKELNHDELVEIQYDTVFCFECKEKSDNLKKIKDVNESEFIIYYANRNNIQSDFG